MATIEKKGRPLSSKEIFTELKRNISALDVVSFAENHLTIDGKPFDLSGAGWKYLAEIYRTVSAQVENPFAQPIVLLKGRQVGATIMAGVLSLHMASSGLYGTESGKPAIRVMHVFPDLKRCGVYAKDILSSLISGAQEGYISKRSLKESAMRGSGLEDSQTEKYFAGMNKIRVDSMGKSGDRIRGSTQDIMFLDECLAPGTQIQTEDGKMAIKTIHRLFQSGKPLPLIKSFNEQSGKFEFKRVLNTWKHKDRETLKITCGNREIRATPNHRLLSTDGWKRIDELTIGDYLYCSSETEQYIHDLNDDQKQIVIGSFLGDGNISSHKKGRSRLAVIHGIAQERYIEWKASMFDVKCTYIEKNGYAQTPAKSFRTKSFGFPELPQKKESVPQWLLDQMDERALAIWYMDDGSKVKNDYGCSISTCSFDMDSNIRIRDSLLSKFGILCSIHISRKKDKSYPYLAMNKENFRKFSELISPYIHDQISYKLVTNQKFGSYVWNNTPKTLGLQVIDKISADKIQEVYDIEIEDNHNFIITSGNTSKNLGGIISHNCQDMHRTAIENTLKVATASPYGAKTKGVQVFFGTPKHTGSYFWTLWDDSDQRFYQLRCKNCDHYFFLYNLEDESWNDIWIREQQVKCPMCSRIQNKCEAVDRGRWFATKPVKADGTAPKHIGFHFNMMLSPLFEKEHVLDYWPEFNKNASERAWRNETKGQFFSASSVPLTLEDIYENCLDETRGVAKSIVNPQGKYYFLGMDWGEKVETDSDVESKRGKSFTCAVILSVDHNGVFTIENATRLKDNSPTYKMNVVKKLMKDFHIEQAAADFYYGNDFVRLVQINEGFGEKFLGCTNLGNSTRVFSYNEKDLNVGIAKDRALEEIFQLFKRGMIKFPAKDDSLDMLSWLVDHVTSMETHIKTKDGVVLPTYKKGTIQNDGLMAIMYAYTAYKFLVTRKFTDLIGDPNVNKNDKDKVVVPVVGHIPRMH